VRWFRSCDPAYAFLWEGAAQPPARWHGSGRGPVHYLADSPSGAWAELVRHEALSDPADLVDVRRAMWAVEVPEDDVVGAARARLPRSVTTGGVDTYERCQAHADRLRAAGATAILAPSAALSRGAAGGRRTDRGLQPAPAADGRVIALIGGRPDLVGWVVVTDGRPPVEVLSVVRPLGTATG
jgi:hypothetical protein